MKKNRVLLTLWVLLSTILLHDLLLAQFTNVRVSSSTSTDPEEVTIAINPTNPLNLVAGANLRYSYFSLDGGLTWTQRQLPVGTYGDPCMVFDAGGRAYYGHLSSLPPPASWIDRITIHRSTDGGQTWIDSSTVGLSGTKAQDKEWLAADMTNSPYRNNLYVAWTQFDNYGSKNSQDSSLILFSRSTTSGQSWSIPVRVSDTGGNCVDSDSTVEGAVPAIGPNGEVYLSWAGPKGIMFDKSLDGGLMFGKDIFVTTIPGGWDFNVSGIYRCNGLPVTACDVSTSPYNGTIYINWTDQRNGAGNTDVFLVKSTDGGQNWGPVQKVNDDNLNREQFFTWMSVDQSTGYLYFVYYDRRNYTDSTTDVYCARSTDGGATFENFKVSQSSFVPRPGIFFGDYTGIAAYNHKIYPIWMRMDGASLSVWTAPFNEPVTASVAEQEQRMQGYVLTQNFPNPFNPSTTIHVSVPRRAQSLLAVYDLLGRRIATLLDGMLEAGRHEVHFYGDNLPGGVYFYRFQSDNFVDTKKLVLVK